MYLKRLEIMGFKSFAEKTAIELHRGINTLLGPNGCGKSNIVDAVVWALGEQSSRRIRAEKMEDVIFNGSEKRKAMSVAEVNLIFDNEDGRIPIDLTEFSIKRRLYRDGESEYSLNGRQMKLKEIRDIFFDTGIGKSAYSIMEQGKIDRILSSKPEERREIFDEAAGINRFKVRGAEAERKRVRTLENITQVEQIRTEVKGRYNALKRQASRTEKHRKLRDEIFLLEKDTAVTRLRKRLQSKELLDQKMAATEKERERITTFIKDEDERLLTRTDEIHTLEKEYVEAQKRHFGVEIDEKHRNERIGNLRERLEEAKKGLESIEVREGDIAGKITENSAAIEAIRIDEAAMEKHLGEIAENISSFEETIEKASGSIKANRRETLQCEERLEKNEKKREEIGENLRTVTDDIVARLDGELKKMGAQIRKRQERRLAFESGLSRVIDRIKETRRYTLVEGGTPLDKINLLFVSLEEEMEDVRNLYNDLAATDPSFIDDFLSPQGFITQKRDIDDQLLQNREVEREVRVRTKAIEEENRRLSKKIEEYRKTLEELRINRVRQKAHRNTLAERRISLERDGRRLLLESERHSREVERNRKISKELGEKIEKELTAREKGKEEKRNLEATLRRLKQTIETRNNEIAGGKNTLSEQRERAVNLHKTMENLRVEKARCEAEEKGIRDSFYESHDRGLEEFLNTSKPIDEADEERLRKELNEKKQALENLGQVNLMAPEEFTEVEERFNFLTHQLEDIRKAATDLDAVIKEIHTESTAIFREIFQQIQQNYKNLFRRLFGGGKSEIRLLDPIDPLNCGIEIYAQPPGKKQENVSLLSGGERSMTAVALLFAVYQVRPSPFSMLDEIDAAMDEANILRFVSLLGEFGKEAQFIIITHNKKTVLNSGSLLGVTMEESGVSKMISVRLDEESVL